MMLAGCTVAAAVVAMLAMSIDTSSAQAGVGRNMSWTVDGQSRDAIVYAPGEKAASGRPPLVLSFHGHGDAAENFQFTMMHRAWPEAVVVYFQGLPRRDSGLPGWQVEKGQDADRDLKLVDAAVSSLRERFNIDDARIYATGFSNGGHFTYLLWAERPGLFAAFAPVAARIRPSVQLRQPKPVLHIAGTADRQVSFADQKQAMDAARLANRVGAVAAGCGPACSVYGQEGRTPVMTLIHDGGHDYPDGTSDRIAWFFRDHALTR
jgi:polyhydroxybutyrate depolymerase